MEPETLKNGVLLVVVSVMCWASYMLGRALGIVDEHLRQSQRQREMRDAIGDWRARENRSNIRPN